MIDQSVLPFRLAETNDSITPHVGLVLFRLVALPAEWSRHQLQTVRWKLYQVAGKVVYHGNRLWLKVRKVWRDLFVGIRRRTYAFGSG